MKNVLFVNTGVVWGGVENWHYDTATGLKKKGYNIFCLTFKNTPFDKECKKAGLNVSNIKRIKDLTFLNIFRIKSLVSYLKKNRIEVVFFCQAPHFKFVSIAAKIAGVKRVVYRRALAKPIKKKFYNKLLLKHCVTDLMGISEITLKQGIKHLPKDCIPNTPLIYNGVKKEKYENVDKSIDLRAEFGIKRDELFLVNIGRLCPQKAQVDFLYAIKNLKKITEKRFKAVIVGVGEDEEKLKKLSSKLEIDKEVIFAGFRKDIPLFLNQADFMVHTAVYEGCPWVVIEAMLSSLPVIAMDISSLPEFIIDNETGYLAKSSDHKDIADKIYKMMKNTDRVELGKKAKEAALKRYTHEKMMDGIESVFL